MHYIFLDTNIYLHFRYFEDIDWEKVTQQLGDYEFVLAPVVFSELDKHKYNNNQSLSKRAKEVVNKLYSTIKKGGLAKKIVHNQKNALPDELFTKNTLSRLNADDNLIASILSFKAGIQDSDFVSFVTYDAGPIILDQKRSVSKKADPLSQGQGMRNYILKCFILIKVKRILQIGFYWLISICKGIKTVN